MIFTAIIFAATFLLVTGSVLGGGLFLVRVQERDQKRARERLLQLERSLDREAESSIFKHSEQMRIANQIGWMKSAFAALQRLLECSHTDISVRTFFGVSVGLGISVGVLTACVVIQAAIPAGMAALFIPLTLLIWKRNSRNQKLVEQLPEAFRAVCRSVKTGRTVAASMKVIADQFPQPIAEEFAQCYEYQDRGLGKEFAFRQLGERSSCPELRLFAVALLIQNRAGGNLVELLENLSGTIEKRAKLRRRTRTLTSEGRMQSAVLLLLPIVAAGGIAIFAPEYGSVLLERKGLIAFTVCIQAIGFLWIYRIINFRF